MSTNALIAIKFNDGNCLYTTVNWDGYLSHAGKVLYNHYNTKEEVHNLIEKGEIRSFYYNGVTEDDIVAEYYDDYDDGDCPFPILVEDIEDEFMEYNYVFDVESNTWETSFVDNSEEIVMELGKALEIYSETH